MRLGQLAGRGRVRRYWLVCGLLWSGLAAAENRVLNLDGEGDYVQLPDGLLDGLRELTVEAWVKWQGWGHYPQPFGFGRAWRALGVNSDASDHSKLKFFAYHDEGELHLIEASGAVGLHRWYHLAVVCDREGMRLYLDGDLLGRNGHGAAPAAVAEGAAGYLGRSQWSQNSDFHGQLDEVRLWGRALDGAEIRAAMRGPPGAGAGLLAWWGFDGGDASDLSGRGRHARLRGDARAVVAAVSNDRLATVAGRVVEESGQTVAGAEVRLYRDGELADQTRSGDGGAFRFHVLSAPSSRYDVQVVSGARGGWATDLRLQAGRRLTLALGAAARLAGRLAALDGSGHAAVVVEALRREHGVWRVAAEAISDANGAYVFTHLKPGRYRVRVHVDGGHLYHGDPAQEVRTDPPPAAGEWAVAAATAFAGVDFRFAPFRKGTWRHFSHLDGLPSNDILYFFQDRDGLVWLATNDYGNQIVTFDGESFAPVAPEFDWGACCVGSIGQDSTGAMLFGLARGVYRYAAGRFARLPLPVDDAKGVMAMTRIGGDMWYGTGVGAVRCGPDGPCERIAAGQVPHIRVYQIAAAADGAIWFALQGGGIIRYDGSDYAAFTRRDGLRDDSAFDIYPQAPDRIWSLGFDGGVSLFDGRRFVNYPAMGVRFDGVNRGIFADDTGAVWLAAHAGVARHDGRSRVIFRPPDLNDAHVTGAYRDRDGRIWLGTGNGLFHYDPVAVAEFTLADGLTRPYRVAVDGDAVWAGQQDRLVRYAGGRWQAVAGAEQAIEGQVWSALRDRDGGMWFGSERGVAHYADGRWARWALEGPATSLAQLAEGDVLVGASGQGIARIANGRSHPFAAGDRWQGHPFYALAAGGPGLLWVQTGRDVRVVTYAPEDYALEAVEDLPSWGLSLWRDADGTVYYDTQQALVRRDGRPGGAELGHIANPNSGDQRVWSLLRDRDGVLWTGTDKGLWGYDGAAWTGVDLLDGMSGLVVNDVAEAGDGALWLATSTGVVRYRKGRGGPGVRIKEIHTNRAGPFSGEVAVGTRVSIDYGAIDYKTHPRRRQYRHRLRPAGGDSVGFGAATRDASFEWVPEAPGDYVFEVQAIDRDLRYSEPARLALTAVWPWYRNAWIAGPLALAFVAAVAGSAFFGGRYYAQRRESRRLREQLLAQEQRARLALEAANAELVQARDEADAARGAAESANRAKSTFLANMSHEIRTPLNAILGYARILNRRPHLDTDIRQPLKTIESSGKHLLELINDILDLAKIEAGRLELEPAVFDLRDLVEGLGAMFGVACQEKGVAWRVEWRAGGPSGVYGDEGKLRQILINLVGNAVKFTDAGAVALRATAIGDEYRFEVIDTGRGIHADDQAGVFQPFGQSRHGTRAEGTGLGLAIARRLIGLMGGVLELQSAPGEGSRFFFTVPLPPRARPAADAVAAPERAVAALQPGSAVAALVVDDMPDNRRILGALLADIGVEVCFAAQGQEALAMVAERRPDIVFMDIWMPVMDGVSAVRALRREYGREGPKVAAVTASVLPHERAQYLAEGFDDFLGKPVDEGQLCACLARLLGVEYVYEEAAPEIAVVPLPAGLARRLREAAEYGRVTDLEALAGDLAQLGPDYAALAEGIRQRALAVDLGAVLALLDRAGEA